MRTTLTLDPDVTALLNKEMRKSGNSLKQVVNETLRWGFTAPKPARKPFKVKPINLGLPHYDKVEELLERLEGPDYR
ncbi:MAG TPA: CopG family transcriptional regulator [Candidatus Solibacter sp.]|nr:CopG family transcriptional regulator [Candidatus Solibacter sp.]